MLTHHYMTPAVNLHRLNPHLHAPLSLPGRQAMVARGQAAGLPHAEGRVAGGGSSSMVFGVSA